MHHAGMLGTGVMQAWKREMEGEMEREAGGAVRVIVVVAMHGQHAPVVQPCTRAAWGTPRGWWTGTGLACEQQDKYRQGQRGGGVAIPTQQRTT